MAKTGEAAAKMALDSLQKDKLDLEAKVELLEAEKQMSKDLRAQEI